MEPRDGRGHGPVRPKRSAQQYLQTSGCTTRDLQTEPDGGAALYVGDVVVDVVLIYETAVSVQSYAVSSDLDPGLPGQEATANLILDYGPGDPKVFDVA